MTEPRTEEKREKKIPRRAMRIILVVILAVLLVWAAISALQQKSLFGDFEQYVELEGIAVEITNNSTQTLTGWYIIYDGEKKIAVNELLPQTTFSCNIDTNQTLDESAVVLHWPDASGQDCQKTIMGFYKQGFDGKTVVSITEDDNGTVLVEPRSSYY